jgi:hypothetical protein
MHNLGLSHEAALHAIMRLKAGLSPAACLESLTVDLPRQRAFLGEFLEGKNNNIGAVVGPYGAGKTHFLQLAKNEALRAGYLVACLGQETGLGTLSYPHRHMQLMLNSLQAASPVGHVLDFIASEIETKPQRFLKDVSTVVSNYCEYQALQETLELSFRYGPETQRTVRAIEQLSGAALARQTVSDKTRLKAYQLLGFWLAYGREVLNSRGLVIIVDELEGLFSSALYWSCRSRRIAYRTLAYYSGLGAHVRVLTALTPDGFDRLQDEVRADAAYIAGQPSVLSGEDLSSLLRKVSQLRPHELRTMTNQQYEMLLRNIKGLHAAARGYSKPIDEAIRIPTVGGMTPRVFSRSVVSALEALWFQRKANAASA